MFTYEYIIDAIRINIEEIESTGEVGSNSELSWAVGVLNHYANEIERLGYFPLSLEEDMIETLQYGCFATTIEAIFNSERF